MIKTLNFSIYFFYLLLLSSCWNRENNNPNSNQTAKTDKIEPFNLGEVGSSFKSECRKSISNEDEEAYQFIVEVQKRTPASGENSSFEITLTDAKFKNKECSGEPEEKASTKITGLSEDDLKGFNQNQDPNNIISLKIPSIEGSGRGLNDDEAWLKKDDETIKKEQTLFFKFKARERELLLLMNDFKEFPQDEDSAKEHKYTKNPIKTKAVEIINPIISTEKISNYNFAEKSSLYKTDCLDNLRASPDNRYYTLSLSFKKDTSNDSIITYNLEVIESKYSDESCKSLEGENSNTLKLIPENELKELEKSDSFNEAFGFKIVELVGSGKSLDFDNPIVSPVFFSNYKTIFEKDKKVYFKHKKSVEDKEKSLFILITPQGELLAENPNNFDAADKKNGLFGMKPVK